VRELNASIGDDWTAVCDVPLADDGTLDAAPCCGRVFGQLVARRSWQILDVRGDGNELVELGQALVSRPSGGAAVSLATLQFSVERLVAGETTRVCLVLSDVKLYARLTWRRALRQWVSFFRQRHLYRRLSAFKFLRRWLSIYKQTVTIESTSVAHALVDESDRPKDLSAWLSAGITCALLDDAAAAATPPGRPAAAARLLRVYDAVALLRVPAPARLTVRLSRPGYDQLTLVEPRTVPAARARLVVEHALRQPICALRVCFPDGRAAPRDAVRALMLRRVAAHSKVAMWRKSRRGTAHSPMASTAVWSGRTGPELPDTVALTALTDPGTLALAPRELIEFEAFPVRSWSVRVMEPPGSGAGAADPASELMLSDSSARESKLMVAGETTTLSLVVSDRVLYLRLTMFQWCRRWLKVFRQTVTIEVGASMSGRADAKAEKARHDWMVNGIIFYPPTAARLIRISGSLAYYHVTAPSTLNVSHV
jgi:hypothetical protein